MKKLYNSPELEIVNFAAMQAVADQFDVSEGDIFEPIPGDEEE